MTQANASSSRLALERFPSSEGSKRFDKHLAMTRLSALLALFALLGALALLGAPSCGGSTGDDDKKTDSGSPHFCDTLTSLQDCCAQKAERGCDWLEERTSPRRLRCRTVLRRQAMPLASHPADANAAAKSNALPISVPTSRTACRRDSQVKRGGQVGLKRGVSPCAQASRASPGCDPAAADSGRSAPLSDSPKRAPPEARYAFRWRSPLRC